MFGSAEIEFTEPLCTQSHWVKIYSYQKWHRRN